MRYAAHLAPCTEMYSIIVSFSCPSAAVTHHLSKPLYCGCNPTSCVSSPMHSCAQGSVYLTCMPAAVEAIAEAWTVEIYCIHMQQKCNEQQCAEQIRHNRICSGLTAVLTYAAWYSSHLFSIHVGRRGSFIQMYIFTASALPHAAHCKQAAPTQAG